MAEPRRARGPGVSANLRRGNAVVGTDCAEVGLPAAIVQDLRARHPFSWRDAFRGKVPAGGFDVVVGNPPYVRPHRIAAAEKAYLRKAFTTFQRKSDLYCCFLERAVECLRPGGRLGYLVSRSWLANDSFEALRRLLLDEVRLSELVECPDSLFADANVRTVIVSGARRDGAETSGIRVGTLSPGGAVTYRGRLRVEDLRANYKHVFDLSQSDPALARIRRTMERAGPLGAEFDVRFGLKTGDDSRFVHARRLHPEDEPLLTGGDVQRWSLRHRGLHVCYDPARMRAHRCTARPGERERFARPKLLVKDTSDDLAAALDAEGHFVKDVLIVTPRTARPAASLEFVAGVLNSAPARWLFRARFDTVHVQKHELAAFPALPGGAPERVREIERLAAELTRLDGADTTVARAAQRELDEAVGAIYGLSPADLRRIAPA